MFVVIFVMIGVSVRKESAVAVQPASNLFSTKNSYNASLELWADQPTETAEDEQIAACCQPIQMAGVYRHGMRYPSSKDIDNMVQVLSEMKRRGVDSETVSRLQSVVTGFANAGPGQLADTGRREQHDLARRATARYPGLFQAVPRLTFFTSSSSRAVDSRRSFERGLTEELVWNVSSTSSNEQRDDLLRLYDACPRYIARVKQNSSAFHEFHKFRRDVYPAVVQRIAKRLTVDELAISNDELDSLYHVAGIELAVLGSSDWATLLDYNDTILLEYAADLKQWYKLGYGHAINTNISCPLISRIFRQMDEQIKENRSVADRSASFYFGHSSTVIPLFTALGLFHDPQPLTSVPVWTATSNSWSVRDRQFRTSRINPMSSNIAFTLYDCVSCEGRREPSRTVVSSSAEEDAVGRYLLRLDVSERPADWPVDGVNHGSAFQTYSYIRRSYSDHIDRCRFDEMCAVSAATLSRANVVYIVIYILLAANN